MRSHLAYAKMSHDGVEHLERRRGRSESVLHHYGTKAGWMKVLLSVPFIRHCPQKHFIFFLPPRFQCHTQLWSTIQETMASLRSEEGHDEDGLTLGEPYIYKYDGRRLTYNRSRWNRAPRPDGPTTPKNVVYAKIDEGVTCVGRAGSETRRGRH